MNGLSCTIRGERVWAGFEGPGTVLLFVTAGVLVVPGSTRQDPVRGFHAELRGVAGTPFDSRDMRWLDKQLPAGMRIGIAVEGAGRPSPPASSRSLALPEEDQAGLRRVLGWLERPFFKKLLSWTAPEAGGGRVESPGRCSHCLSIERNGEMLATIGAPWSAMARVTLTLPEGGAPACRLELTGSGERDTFNWGSFPLQAGDHLVIGLLPEAVPDPVSRHPQANLPVLVQFPLLLVFGLVRLFGGRPRRKPGAR